MVRTIKEQNARERITLESSSSPAMSRGEATGACTGSSSSSSSEPEENFAVLFFVLFPPAGSVAAPEFPLAAGTEISESESLSTSREEVASEDPISARPGSPLATTTVALVLLEGEGAAEELPPAISSSLPSRRRSRSSSGLRFAVAFFWATSSSPNSSYRSVAPLSFPLSRSFF